MNKKWLVFYLSDKKQRPRRAIVFAEDIDKAKSDLVKHLWMVMGCRNINVCAAHDVTDNTIMLLD